MDFNQLAKSRYSSRSYKAQPVEEEKLNYVLEAGRIAPSAVNYQPVYFVVVRGSNLENVRSCYPANGSARLRVHRGMFDHSGRGRGRWQDSADIDAAIAADHITLAATGSGLATCWVCNFDKEGLTKALNLPDHVEPVVMLPIGYPNDTADINRHSSKRKPLEELVIREKF